MTFEHVKTQAKEMGKTKKLKPSQVGQKVPLEQDIEDAKFVKPKNRNKVRLRKDDDEEVNSLFPTSI